MRVCIILPPAPGLFDQRTNVPLGPLYVAAVLEEKGHEVVMISLLGRDIPASWPEADLYAIGFTTPQAWIAKGIKELIRGQHARAKILAAGAHPTVMPFQTLEMGFDSVLVGEAEIAIFDILDDLPNLDRVYRGAAVADLDVIPNPARYMLPREDVLNDASGVFREDRSGQHVASIMGSRGCPFNCSFCGNPPAGVFRYRSAQSIVSEMRQLVDLGVTYFKFQDDSFTIVPENVRTLGTAIREGFGEGAVHTRMHTRVDMMSPKLVKPLKMMGTDLVALGIESGSQAVLDLNNKGVTVGESERALRIAHDAGFTTLGFFMFGLPGETDRTVDETLEFIGRNGRYLDKMNMSVFVPYPGCDVAMNPRKYRVHIIEDDWNLYWGTQKREVLVLPYGMTYDGMMALLKRTFRVLREFGYGKPEWEADFAEDDEMVGRTWSSETTKSELPFGEPQHEQGDHQDHSGVEEAKGR